MSNLAGRGAGVIQFRETSRARGADSPDAPRSQYRHAVFTQLVEDHDERLRALTYQLLGDPQAMDDVLQDVYVKAYRALPSFRGEASLSTWLYRITYTTCMDRLRRRTTSDPLPVEAAQDAPSVDPEAGEQVALGDDLRRALGGLDAEHRAAVLLVLRDGHSYDSAAEILGVPRGTVASRVARARRHLTEALAPQYQGGQS
jgi:RNA polymerase sigma-70 factor, ECF subfamily